MRAKLINEKFTDKSDPIKDMGIGVSEYEALIEKILHSKGDQLEENIAEFRGKLKIRSRLWDDDRHRPARFKVVIKRKKTKIEDENNKPAVVLHIYVNFKGYHDDYRSEKWDLEIDMENPFVAYYSDRPAVTDNQYGSYRQKVNINKKNPYESIANHVTS